MGQQTGTTTTNLVCSRTLHDSLHMILLNYTLSGKFPDRTFKIATQLQDTSKMTEGESSDHSSLTPKKVLRLKQIDTKNQTKILKRRQQSFLLHGHCTGPVLLLTKDERAISIYAAEFVGTFVFSLSALVTSAANETASGYHAPCVFNISLGFGISLLTIAACISNFSGDHHNPSVALAFFLSGNMSMARSGIESLMQVIADMAATGVASGIFPGPVTFDNKKAPNFRTS